MLEVAFWAAALSAGIRLGIPVLLAATGELVAQRSGVLNVGLEGMMAAGGFVGLLITAQTGSYAMGAAAGILAGAGVAGVMVLSTIYGGADQIVAGFGVLVLSTGIVDFMNASQTFSAVLVPPTLTVPLLGSLPFLGDVLFTNNAYFYTAIAASVGVWALLFHSKFGLEVSAVGQDPVVAGMKGIRVRRTRAIATIIAGALAGLGGAALVVGALGNYTPGITAGRGFVAIALVIVGRWSPGWTVVAALLFGVADGLQLSLANRIALPSQVFAILPWLTVLAMLTVSGRRTAMPRALGRRLQIGGSVQ